MSRFDLYDWIKGLQSRRRPRRGNAAGGGSGGGGTATLAAPGPQPQPNGGALKRVILTGLVLALVYGVYFWEIRRVVVPADHVLVLMKKDGAKALPGDGFIIPRAPDKQKEPEKYAAWERQYGDCNGILEEVMPEGVYFKYSPFDYERWVIDLRKQGGAIIPNKKVGVVVKKFGNRLPAGQVLADPSKDQRGPLPQLLFPGRYNEYANPWAYEIKQFDPVVVEPGYEGVITLMAAQPAKNPNDYLVAPGEQGTQPTREPPGFRYVNLYEKRITPIDMRSHKFEMAGKEVIEFPSSDSFTIRMQGFVEWRIIPDKLPLIYVQYAEGNELIPYLEETVILPYARSYSRLVGSQYTARDFITGDTKLKFQQQFDKLLREKCKDQGIEIRQALVRDIEPPQAIKDPINDREIAREQIKQYEQQILVAKTQAEFTTQEQMAEQNKSIGDANRQVVTIIKKAEQARDVAVTKANQELEVARLRLEAAKNEASAVLARGQAEAAVILLNKEAQAKPLAQQVSAFGDGTAYAQYFFNQKLAGSVKTILTNTDGPMGELFKQFLTPHPAPATRPSPGSNKFTGIEGH
jgi:regulator of protease activity HflC (stomatin/prohibitin superfamily)